MNKINREFDEKTDFLIRYLDALSKCPDSNENDAAIKRVRQTLDGRLGLIDPPIIKPVKITNYQMIRKI